MSIQSEVSRLESAKSAIADAITAKGVAVPASAKLDSYAGLVAEIPAGGGVQPDWNQNDPAADDYIKNRPCYTDGFALDWDGNTEGLETVKMGGSNFYKVLATPPTLEFPAVISMDIKNGESIDLMEKRVEGLIDSAYVNIGAGVFVYQDCLIGASEFAPGVWLAKLVVEGTTMWPISVVDKSATVVPLADRYIPGWVARSWDLSSYATTDYVEQLIGGIENGSY